MKILVLNHEYPPLGGGGAVFARDLAEEWAKEGHSVEVITSGTDPKHLKKKERGVLVHRVFCGQRNDRSLASIGNLFLFLAKGLVAGIKSCQKTQPDYLVTHFALPAGPIGFLLQLIFSKKNILVLHGADIYDPTRKMSGHRLWITRKIIELAVNKADWVIASTKEIRSQLEKFYSTKKKVTIIPLGFKPPFKISVSVPNQDSSEPLRLITVGRLVERKNILFLIEAISKLKEKAELVVVGEGPLRKELKEKAKNMGASVSFLGRVTEEEKYTALKKADLFTMASWHEGFGIVFLEAMAAGLPIISTNRGGQTYFLKKDRNACFFSPSNLDSFLSAFDFFYKNREKLKEFGSNNQEAVRRFYIANIAKRYLELMV